MNKQQIIEKLTRNREELHGYEFNAYENAEIERLVKRGASLRSAMTQVADMRFKKSNDRIDMGGGGNVAQFDILIRRVTANIASALPVPIFGAVHFASAYNGLLDLPSGVTITGFNVGINDPTLPNPDSLEIEYTSGLNVDTVVVTCNQIAYPSFLASMNGNDIFELSKIRISLSDATQVAQFNQTYKKVEKSLFGRQTSDSLPVSSAKTPEQFQNGIVDVDGKVRFNKISFLSVGILNVAAFTVTLSSFVRQYSKDAF